VFLPWSIANRAVALTYLYPLLGPGIHVSAYHFIPKPSQMASWPLLYVLMAPGILLLSLNIAVVYKLTPTWNPAVRSASIAYLIAALIALPITVYGLGGQSTDRYTAPFVIPAILVSLLVVLGTDRSSPRRWRRLGVVTQVIAGIYFLLFINVKFAEYANLKTLAYQAIGAPLAYPAYMYPLDSTRFKQEMAYGARIQSAIPEGAVALSVVQRQYLFDYRRNTIDIADWPGMASPPPGLPLTGGPEDQRKFFVNAGIDYLIYDNGLDCTSSDWQSFFALEHARYRWNYFLVHELSAHSYIAWEILEAQVSCHEQYTVRQIIDRSPQVYNDGHIIVARIN